MRRFLFFCVTIGLLLFALWSSKHPGPLPWQKSAVAFTPADAPKLDLKDMQVLAAMDAEYTKLVDAVVPSVVSITTSRRVASSPQVTDPFELLFRGRFRSQPRESIQNSLGSGVIVSKEGHILTNNHVIADVDEVEVQLNDGRKLNARLIGTDEDNDIAVLKIDGSNLQPLRLGDSDQVKVGQLVFAVGNPFGLQETVTRGIISAKGRNIIKGSENQFFQTDTAINPGNSGGPLLNLRGEIIAINSSIYSGSGGWQGIGFAIPANVARSTLEAVLKHGSPDLRPRGAKLTNPTPGYLGVIIQSLTPEIAQELGLRDAEGAVVTGVAQGSPAEKAGLREGDVITRFDGHVVRDADDLHRRVGETSAPMKVKIVLIREGSQTSLTAAISQKPVSPQALQPPPTLEPENPPEPGTAHQPSDTRPLAGITVAEIPDEHRANLPSGIKGVMVSEIDPNSPAGQVLRETDIIEEINHRPVPSVAAYKAIRKTLNPSEKQMLFICRGMERSFVVIGPQP